LLTDLVCIVQPSQAGAMGPLPAVVEPLGTTTRPANAYPFGRLEKMLAALTTETDVDVKIYDAESNEISRTASKNLGRFMADLLFGACRNSMDMFVPPVVASFLSISNLDTPPVSKVGLMWLTAFTINRLPEEIL